MKKPRYLREALLSFLGAVGMALVVFVSVTALVHHGAGKILGLTILAKEAVACCETIFSVCLLSPTMAGAIMPWVGMGMVGVGFLMASLRALRAFYLKRRFLKGLVPISLKEFPLLEKLSKTNGITIIPFEDGAIKTAFTMGLIHPVVYVSGGLTEELDEEELRAVLFHELYHARKRDPLRAFLLTFIKDMFFFLPLGGYLLERFFVAKELAADEGAVSMSASPFALAGALVKLLRVKSTPLSFAIPIVDRRALVERRVKELLEPGSGKTSLPASIMIATIIMAGLLLASLTLPLYAGSGRLERCNHEYCLSKESVCPSDATNCQKVCERMERM